MVRVVNTYLKAAAATAGVLAIAGGVAWAAHPYAGEPTRTPTSPAAVHAPAVAPTSATPKTSTSPSRGSVTPTMPVPTVTVTVTATPSRTPAPTPFPAVTPRQTPTPSPRPTPAPTTASPARPSTASRVPRSAPKRHDLWVVERVPYPTQTLQDPNRPFGQTKVLAAGRIGYRKVWTNPQTGAKRVEVLLQPQTRVVAVGMKKSA